MEPESVLLQIYKWQLHFWSQAGITWDPILKVLASYTRALLSLLCVCVIRVCKNIPQVTWLCYVGK